MPKRGDDPIPDSLLLSNGVHDLDRDLPLSPRQVHRMTGLSLGDLAEYRRTRPPKPPLARVSEKKGAKVWYPLGEVLDWRAARKPVIRTASPRSKTFAAFMGRGAMDDEWVFARTKEGQLVDFFTSLRLGPLLDYGADCEWLSMAQYVEETKVWVQTLGSHAQARSLAQPDVMPVDKKIGSLCPSCGRPKLLNHRCRL